MIYKMKRYIDTLINYAESKFWDDPKAIYEKRCEIVKKETKDVLDNNKKDEETD
jgi:hypothetical protein